MVAKSIDLSKLTYIPALRDLTPEEEAAVLKQYKTERTAEALEADYADFDKQVVEGVSAEQLLKELRDASRGE